MTKTPPAGERVADVKRALEAAEFVDEATAWAHRLILDEGENQNRRGSVECRGDQKRAKQS